MRTLVTGATGLVGANLARALLRQGDAVRVLLRPESTATALDGLPVERVIGDVLTPSTVRTAAADCGVIYHCATAFAYWGDNAHELKRVAVEGCRNVVSAAQAAGVRRVVLTASSIIFGSSEEPRGRDEHDTWTPDEPVSPYFAAKVAQWREFCRAARRARVHLVAVCPTVTVGAHDHRLNPSNAIILNYLNDPLRTTFPGGVNVVAADDVAHGHMLAARLGRPGGCYILGGENLTWSQLHHLIAELAGVPGPVLQATHVSSYLAAAGWELYARVTGRRPPVTRHEARMVGRFYWYHHKRATALGYDPRGARDAVACALSWLVASPHLSAATRRTLRVSDEVYAARSGWASAGDPVVRT